MNKSNNIFIFPQTQRTNPMREQVKFKYLMKCGKDPT